MMVNKKNTNYIKTGLIIGSLIGVIITLISHIFYDLISFNLMYTLTIVPLNILEFIVGGSLLYNETSFIIAIVLFYSGVGGLLGLIISKIKK